MKLTQEADYAVRIIINLASVDERRSAGEISSNIAVTPRFTLKILRKLIAAGLVKSFMGVTGGYKLTKPAAEITLLEIITAIDGDVYINKCLNPGTVCTRVGKPENCKTHAALSDINMMIAGELEKVSVESLI